MVQVRKRRRLVSPKTPAAYIRRYAEPLLQGVDHIEISEVTDKILPLLFEDEGFLLALNKNVRSMTADVIRTMVSQTRGLLPMGSEIVSTEEFQRRSEMLRHKLGHWMEHAGERHHLLAAMTKEDFLRAADEREMRGIAEFNLAGLWRTVAADLNPGQTPVQRWGMSWESIIEQKAREAAIDIFDRD